MSSGIGDVYKRQTMKQMFHFERKCDCGSRVCQNQTFTDLRVNADTLGRLAERCDEFLIHGVDVEGLGQGIDEDLVRLIAEHSPIPATYPLATLFAAFTCGQFMCGPLWCGLLCWGLYGAAFYGAEFNVRDYFATKIKKRKKMKMRLGE